MSVCNGLFQDWSLWIDFLAIMLEGCVGAMFKLQTLKVWYVY